MASLALPQTTTALKSIPLSRFTEFLETSSTLPVEKAYNNVGWFRRAQDIRTEATRTYPYDLRRGDTVIANEARDDAHMPPQELDIFPILDDLSADLDMFGRAYALYETNRFGRNGKWRRLHPSTMTPIYDQHGLLTHFERRIRAGGKAQEIEVDTGTFVYLWMPNREAETGPGSGVSQASLLPATALNNIDKFQAAFFENGALNPTLVNVKGLATQPEAEKDRIRNWFQRLFSGLRNAFRIEPIDGDVSLHSLMQPLREMAMDELSTQKREDVLSGMGVPHSMVMSNAANFATAKQDRLNFYDNTMNGHVALIADQLNERLFKPAGYSLRFMKQRLEVYQASEAEKADKLSSQLDRAVIDVGEYRQQMGLEPNTRLESIFYTQLEAQLNISQQAANDSEREAEAMERLQLNPQGDSNPDANSDSKVAIPSSQVFGYHIENEIVSINEARAQLGLPPKRDEEADRLQRLQTQLAVMLTATNAGVPPNVAAGLVGIDTVGIPDSKFQSSSDTKHMELGESATHDLQLWERKAIKRFEEGTPEKALEFDSKTISALQHRAIVEALTVAKTSDDVRHIFKEAQYVAPLWAHI